MSLRIVAVVVLAAGCTPAAAPPPPAPTPAPDAGKRVVAEHAIVTSAHPLASEAGLEMLRRGGNAVDAAVAAAFAVGVAEPQMSGLGGGGAMLLWLEQEGRAEYLDFYAAQRPASFRGLAHNPSAGLRETAIPGEVAGLLAAHERYGRLPRAEVIAPAIRLAEEGFAVNQVLAQMIRADSAKLRRDPDARREFWPEGRPLRPGEVLRQPELAETLRRVAEQGADGFYRGETARRLVAELRAGGHPATAADLAAYEPRWMRPLCTEYRGRVVLSAPPPQTGMQVLHTLELLEPFDLDSLGLPTRSAPAFDVLTSALRVGMAAGEHVDDPAWADVPAAAVASEAYARARAGLVGVGRAPERIESADPGPFRDAPAPPGCAPLQPYGSARGVAAGIAPGTDGEAAPALPRPTTRAGTGVPSSPGSPGSPSGGETTHLSVVDADGNAVSLTRTNSSLFGSGARVAGFFLNDSGIDFSRPDAPDGVGSREWRTRRSTISPTVILSGGDVEMVVGAPGGGRIPTAIVQAIVYVLDYGMDPLEALRMPRIFPSAENPRVQLENGFAADVLREARGAGYEPDALSFGYARLYLIARRGGAWVGVADPRHDGEPRGY